MFAFFSNRNYASQLSTKERLLEESREFNKACRTDLINESKLLVECNSRKTGITDNDLLKYQIEENVKMMNKCIEQQDTKTVEDPGYLSRSTSKYTSSNQHCKIIAKEYENYNMLSHKKDFNKAMERKEQN